MRKKILTVLGTRPEAIKLSPILLEFEKHGEHFESFLLVTGQHRKMLDQVLSFFGLQPNHDLNLMKHNQRLSNVLSDVIRGVDDAIERLKPNLVMVQGDTTSTLGAALAAFYNKVPVGHVEAGLRTGNLIAPYPEEGNRQLVSRITDFHFAPTDLNKHTLLAEGTPEDRIFVTGNSVIDALLWTKEKISQGYETQFVNPRVQEIVRNHPFILITGHRRENFGDGFRNICEALRCLSERHKDIHFIFPVHLNPNVRDPVFSMLSNLENFHLIDPVDYPSFIYLMDKCYLILSDSGGVQEEAPSLGKPVLVMRGITERQEAVQAGTIKLIGTDCQKIIDETERLIKDPAAYRDMVKRENPYGNGNTAKWIVKILKERL